MLRVEELSKRYDTQEVLREISLGVGPEIKVIIGVNGCGKSTLLKIIAGIVGPDRGKIELKGKDITMFVPEARRVGYVPQHPALFSHKTVENNIRYGMRNGFGSEELINKIIGMLDLKKVLNKKPGELSGGYKSRVSVARALAPQPDIMLLDEPLSDIDVVVKERLLPEFREVLKLLRIPVLYVTHDPAEARLIGDTFSVMVGGRIKEIESAGEAFDVIRSNALYAAGASG